MMADDSLPKRAAEVREQGRMRRGRPRMRWEDCVKRDVRKAGEEEDWKKKTRDRGGWKRLSDGAVRSCGQHLTPRSRCVCADQMTYYSCKGLLYFYTFN